MIWGGTQQVSSNSDSGPLCASTGQSNRTDSKFSTVEASCWRQCMETTVVASDSLEESSAVGSCKWSAAGIVIEVEFSLWFEAIFQGSQ